jgi:hypothetical protein
LCELAAQRVGVHEVDELLLAVDLDHRDQLAEPRLELGVAVDRDLLELEPELVPGLDERRPRPLAEMAALRPVQNDSRDTTRG